MVECIEDASMEDMVTEADLHNSFYSTLNKLQTNLNSKNNRNKIFESSAKKKMIWPILMTVAIFFLITVGLVLEYGEFDMESWPFLLVPAIGFVSVLIGILYRNPISAELYPSGG